jgi:hypothetical protein
VSVSGAPAAGQCNIPDDCQRALDHMSQNKKIEIISYFDEPGRYDDTLCTMLYRSHVSLKYMQTGQQIIGSSMDVESQSKARQQAAEHAWCQIESIEQGMVAKPLQIQQGRGDYCYYLIVTITIPW